MLQISFPEQIILHFGQGIFACAHHKSSFNTFLSVIFFLLLISKRQWKDGKFLPQVNLIENC
jgi:hypothetical protein